MQIPIQLPPLRGFNQPYSAMKVIFTNVLPQDF